MAMSLPAAEPAAGPWRAVRPARLLQQLTPPARRPNGSALLPAVDGRSGSGKSTLAGRLHDAVPRSAVVHTDDLAWHESFFGWDHLLTQLLEPLRRGEPAHLIPPAWPRRGWMAAELRFLDEQRPWERADVIVAGTPALPLEPGELAVAGPLP